MNFVINLRSSRALLKVFGIIFLVMIPALSCAPKSSSSSTDSSSTSACFTSGDIIVSNSGSDAVLVLDANGNFKNIAYNVANNAETVYGITYDSTNNRLLVAVDGSDRIVEVSSSDCTATSFVTDVNLTGNVRGIAQITGGDLLVVESNNVERFTSLGLRVTAGGWPKTLQTGGTGIRATAAGGFVHCSNTTDVVRVYDSSATQLFTASSAIGATTDALDCLELANGDIAVTWSGTTDTIQIYDPTLGSTVATYSDTSVLPTPGGIAERANGNLLITDRALHYIVEITAAGAFVQFLGDGVLNFPEFILVVP